MAHVGNFNHLNAHLTPLAFRLFAGLAHALDQVFAELVSQDGFDALAPNDIQQY
jgi:hypothetical protein